MAAQTPSLALQLYSLRAELVEDFDTVVREVAAAGYAGVEPFGYPARGRRCGGASLSRTWAASAQHSRCLPRRG